jgi:hypothetical protein
MPVGPVRLQITSPGFNTSVINGVVASNEKPAKHDITLQIGSVAQTVEVSASAMRFKPIPVQSQEDHGMQGVDAGWEAELALEIPTDCHCGSVRWSRLHRVR